MPPLPSPKPLTAKTTDSKRCGHNTNNLHKKVCSNMRSADPGLKDSPFKLKGPEKKIFHSPKTGIKQLNC